MPKRIVCKEYWTRFLFFPWVSSKVDVFSDGQVLLVLQVLTTIEKIFCISFFGKLPKEWQIRDFICQMSTVCSIAPEVWQLSDCYLAPTYSGSSEVCGSRITVMGCWRYF